MCDEEKVESKMETAEESEKVVNDVENSKSETSNSMLLHLSI